MWVIKIGGSLQESSYLPDWLGAITTAGRGKVIVVPGGGKFADAVRQEQRGTGFDDRAAHLMALRAMEKYAQLLKGLNPELQLAETKAAMKDCLASNGVPVWLPSKLVAGDASIPASWDVTSDSLAAWLAVQMKFRSLILIKSVPLPEFSGGFAELACRGLVDPALYGFVKGSDLKISWLNRNEADRLAGILEHTSNQASGRAAVPYK